MRSWGVRPSFVVMTFAFIVVTNFSFLSFSIIFLFFFRFVCGKTKALAEPLKVISDERPQELVRQTDSEVLHSYLLVADSASTHCPASHYDVLDSYK